VLQDGVRLRKEMQWKNKDGAVTYYDVEKMPLMEDGEVVGIVGIARNITERKMAEEKLREQETLLLHASRLSSMGELAAGIAHEINQPLYSILNYARAVKNTLDGSRTPSLEDIGDWVDQILSEAARGGEISKRLRSFVRRTDSQRQHASVTSIVQESVEFLVGEVRSSGVQIESLWEENLPLVSVDRVQIQQVMVNLLKNAIEALQAHEVNTGRITISTRRVPEGVKVVVADNGPGISTDPKIDITEPFYTTKNDGVGLGLAISNTIIEAHKSKLFCERNESGGATFHFTLCGAHSRLQSTDSGVPELEEVSK
jgi:two-component system sensor kinase FixL